MKCRIWISRTLRCALLSAAVVATGHAAQVVTLKDAVQLALERNATVLKTQVSAALGQVAVSEARLAFTPNLSASAFDAENYGRYFDPTTGTIVQQTTQSATLGVSSGINLFNGFHDIASLRKSKFDHRGGELDAVQAQQAAVYDVVAKFLTLANRREQQRVLREHLAAEADLARKLRQYIEAGARAASDLYQEQAYAASVRLAVAEAKSATEAAEVDLLETLQLDPAGSYDFQMPESPVVPASDSRELPDLISRALSRRADVQAEEVRVQAAEAGVGVAHAGYWPTLTLVAGYGSSYTSSLPGNFNQQLNSQVNGNVGLNFSIPLFDQGAARNASHRARLQLQMARIELERTREAVGLDVRRAQLAEQSAREVLQAAEDRERAADQAVNSSQQRFQAGAGTLVELSLARTEQLQARSALVSARTNLILQRTLMEYLLGNLDSKSVAEG